MYYLLFYENISPCQNSTLDQVSLCTDGRLNDVAPRPVPPALGGRQPRPRGPVLTFLFPPLILIQPGVPFAVYDLLACCTATALCMPQQLWSTVSPHKFTSSVRQLHQIERVSPGWRQWVFCSPRCSRAFKQQKQSVLLHSVRWRL